jgi:redox-sensing transcriptional repressor
MTPVLVRKDLSMLGHFGKSRRGYEVSELQSAIKSAMGLDRRWNVVTVGSGMRARAVADLISRAGESFRIIGVFTPSSSTHEAGTTIAGQTVQPLSTLPITARRAEINIGVMADTLDQTEMILSTFDACGVRAVVDSSGGYPTSRPGIDMRHFGLLPHLSGLTHGLLHPELLETDRPLRQITG